MLGELLASGLRPKARRAERRLLPCGAFPKNNGITKGFHRKMKLIQRHSYGLRDFHHDRLRVIAQWG